MINSRKTLIFKHFWNYILYSIETHMLGNHLFAMDRAGHPFSLIRIFSKNKENVPFRWHSPLGVQSKFIWEMLHYDIWQIPISKMKLLSFIRLVSSAVRKASRALLPQCLRRQQKQWTDPGPRLSRRVFRRGYGFR